MITWISTLIVGMLLLVGMVMLDKTVKNANARRWLPYVEGLAWIAYLLVGAYFAFGEYSFYAYLLQAQILLLVMGIGWIVGREYIPGIFVRAAIAKQGMDRMLIDGVDGKIINAKSLWIEVASPQGVVTVVPYSKASIRYISDVQHTSKQHAIKTFHIEMPKNQAIDEKKLRQALISMPWASAKSTPIVKSHTKDPNVTVWEISLSLLKGSNPKQVEAFIREAMRQDGNL